MVTPNPEPPPFYGAPVPPPAYMPPPARRPNRLPWIIAGVVLLLFLCVGGSVAVVSMVSAFQGLEKENQATLALIEQFMQAGEQNDPQAGYALFAPGYNVTLDNISTLYQTRRDLFDGYQAVHGGDYRITTTSSGTYANIGGTVSYSKHANAPFTATLVKVNGHWALTSMQFQEGVGK